MKCNGAVVERVCLANFVPNEICASQCADIFSAIQTLNDLVSFPSTSIIITTPYEVLLKSLGFYFAFEHINPKSFVHYYNHNFIRVATLTMNAIRFLTNRRIHVQLTLEETR